MTDFVSVLEMAESRSYSDQRSVRDEVADMEFGIRREMDRGLSPDEMRTAQAAREAVQAAASILDKLFA